ncbi:MAG: HAMP domain-containing protein [Oscillochloridaceae bacterium umkhey_bin13]
MKRSLRISLLLLLISLSLVPVAAVGLVLGLGIFQQERSHALDLQRQLTDQAAAQMSAYVTMAEGELYALLQRSRSQGEERPTLNTVLAEELFYRSTFDELAIVLADGTELARVSRLGPTRANDLHNHEGDPILVETIRLNRAYLTGFTRSATNQEPLLEMAIPTLDPRTGLPDGVIIGKVRMRRLFEQITSLDLGRTGAVFVTDEQFRLVAHPKLASLPPEVQTIAPDAEGLTASLGGDPALGVLRPTSLGNLTLLVGAELPLAEADEDLREALITAGAILLAITVLTMGLTVMVTGRIVAPIHALAAAAERISTGDLNQRVAVTREDELGTLQRNFNQMVTDLGSQRLALTERSEALQLSLDRQRVLVDTVAQLSTPVLPVWEGVIVLPVVGHVDAERGAALVRALVQEVSARRAKVAIIDITGLSEINQQVLDSIGRAVRAVELLGAQALLAGVSVEAAQHMVLSQVSLGNLASYRDLQSATEAALALRHS